MAIKALLTSEEFEQIVPRLPGDRDWELIRGELYEVSPVTQRHCEVAAEACSLFRNWNKQAKAGRVGVEGGYTIELRPDTVRAPDVSFVRKGRIPRDKTRRGFPAVAPDLVVEVKSPGDSWRYLIDKAQQFFTAGTRMAVLMEPDQFIEVHRPGQEPRRLGLDDVFDGEDVLPGFTCKVSDFFPEEYE